MPRLIIVWDGYREYREEVPRGHMDDLLLIIILIYNLWGK